jgi:hypothetical protein
VGKHGNEESLKNYVKNQNKDKDYNILYQQQLKLW